MSNELKLIEKDGLIKVYEAENGVKVVDGRELWEGLESKQDFSTWIKKRLDDCDAIENDDYIRFHEKMEANNAVKIEYILMLDIAKEMAMLEKNDKGKQYRRYLIDLEKKYQKLQKDLIEKNELILRVINGQTQQERMIALSEYNQRVNQQLNEKDNIIMLQAEKTSLFDDFINSENLYSVDTVSKAFGIKGLGKTNFYDYLRQNEIFMDDTYIDSRGRKQSGLNHYKPYAKYVNQQQYFKTRTRSINKGYKILQQDVGYFTAKGVEWIYKKLKKDGRIIQKSIDDIINSLKDEAMVS